MSLNIFIQAAYILYACNNAFYGVYKKKQMEIICSSHTACLFWWGGDNKDLFHFAVCCRMPCNKLRSKMLLSPPSFECRSKLESPSKWKTLFAGYEPRVPFAPLSCLLTKMNGLFRLQGS